MVGSVRCVLDDLIYEWMKEIKSGLKSLSQPQSEWETCSVAYFSNWNPCTDWGYSKYAKPPENMGGVSYYCCFCLFISVLLNFFFTCIKKQTPENNTYGVFYFLNLFNSKSKDVDTRRVTLVYVVYGWLCVCFIRELAATGAVVTQSEVEETLFLELIMMNSSSVASAASPSLLSQGTGVSVIPGSSLQPIGWLL